MSWSEFGQCDVTTGLYETYARIHNFAWIA